MERWEGRVAVVTGASSGIGAAVAEELTKKGLKVVGIARRVERIEELSKSLKSAKGKLYAVKADLVKEDDVKSAFDWIKSNVGGVDILINNAAVASHATFSEGPEDVWKNTLDLNVMALSRCIHKALQSMKERGVDDGHIVNINSVAGQYVSSFPGFCMYSASKHAVKVLSEGLRHELVSKNSKIRVTNVSPGLVKTEMPPDVLLKEHVALEAKDIADGILYALSVPPNVQIGSDIPPYKFCHINLVDKECTKCPNGNSFASTQYTNYYEIQEITIRPVGEKF